MRVGCGQDAEPFTPHEQLGADEPHAHAVDPRAAGALQLEGRRRGQRHRGGRRGAPAEARVAHAADEQGQLAGQPGGALSRRDDLRGHSDLGLVLEQQAAPEQSGQVPHARLHRVPRGHAGVRLLRARHRQQQQRQLRRRRKDAGAGESQSARLSRQHPQDPGAGLWEFRRIRGKKKGMKEESFSREIGKEKEDLRSCVTRSAELVALTLYFFLHPKFVRLWKELGAESACRIGSRKLLNHCRDVPLCSALNHPLLLTRRRRRVHHFAPRRHHCYY